MNTSSLLRRIAGLPLVAACLVAHAAPPTPDTSAATSTAESPLTPPRVLRLPVGDPGTGHWLMLSADDRVLRDGGLKQMLPFRMQASRVLPAAAQAGDGRWGYLDAQGRWALAPQLELARNFAETDGLARFRQKGLWGYLDTVLKVRVKPQWSEASPFRQGRAAVQAANGQWGVIDSNGLQVVPPRYQLIGEYGKTGLARASTGENQWLYLDRQGGVRFRVAGELALEFGDFEAAPVEADDQWGLVDTQGRWIVKPVYSDLDAFQAPGLAAFRQDSYDERGFVDVRGQVAIPADAMSGLIRQGLIRTGSEGSSAFGFVDAKGRPAMNGSVFDWVSSFDEEGPTPARRQGRWGLLHASGQWVDAGNGREPVLTASENQHELTRGLSLWLQAGQAYEWKDGQGRTVYRLTQTESAPGKKPVLQLHAGERLIWSQTALATPLSLTPFFEPRSADLTRLRGPALVQEAQRLLKAPPRSFYPTTQIYGERRNPYDILSLDKDERSEVYRGGMTVLAQTYVSEEDWGTYYFLDDQRDAVFKALGEEACRTLGTALGSPVKPLKDEDKAWHGQRKLCSWQQDGRQLMVVAQAESGDGDFERQLWLVMLPAR